MTTPAVFHAPRSGQSYRSRYPLDFSLRDQWGRAVLAVSDVPAGHDMVLTIVNAADAQLSLDAPNSDVTTASADHHHFALHFPPGLLSATSLKLGAWETSEWMINLPSPEPRADAVIYLLSKAALSLAPDQQASIVLPGLTAAGDSGAGGSGLELRYPGLQYGDGRTPLPGRALGRVDLMNQHGSQQIPLRAYFTGAGAVLNDGTPNQLKLHLNNIGPDPIRLASKEGAPRTTLVISFDSGGEWAIAENLATVTVEIAGWGPPTQRSGPSPSWQFVAPEGKTELASGETLVFTIGEIRTTLPAGSTNLYLRYENMPDYWDGQFVLPVQKGPLSYDATGTRVGIRTERPAYTLSVDPHGQGGILVGSNGSTDQDIGYTQLALEVSAAKGGQSSIQAVSASGSAYGQLNLNPAGGTVTVGVKTKVNLDVNGSIAADDLEAGAVRATGSLSGGTVFSDGQITSPMWQATKPINQTGPLPISTDIVTRGGTLIFFVSGSGFRSTTGLVGAHLWLGDQYVGQAMSVHVVATPFLQPFEIVQRAYFSGVLTLPPVPAGSYKLLLQSLDNRGEFTGTADVDVFSVFLLELPF